MRLHASTVEVNSGPSVEPVTLDEAKAQCRQTLSVDDTYITGLIPTARRKAEKDSGKAFITQTLTAGLDRWPPDGFVELPYPPLQSVTSIKYVDDDGDEHTLSTDVYGVDTKRARVYLKNNQSWPSDGLRNFDPITITWVAGYGDAADDVPDTYKHAIKLLISHWYENREPYVIEPGVTSTQVQLSYDSLVSNDGTFY